jgi:oligopeptide transport system ATP-binding protein
MEDLPTIPGQPPNLQHLPPGCSFHDRCVKRFDRCVAEIPVLIPLPGVSRSAACHLCQPS